MYHKRECYYIKLWWWGGSRAWREVDVKRQTFSRTPPPVSSGPEASV